MQYNILLPHACKGFGHLNGPVIRQELVGCASSHPVPGPKLLPWIGSSQHKWAHWTRCWSSGRKRYSDPSWTHRGWSRVAVQVTMSSSRQPISPSLVSTLSRWSLPRGGTTSDSCWVLLCWQIWCRTVVFICQDPGNPSPPDQALLLQVSSKAIVDQD